MRPHYLPFFGLLKRFRTGSRVGSPGRAEEVEERERRVFIGGPLNGDDFVKVYIRCDNLELKWHG